MRDKVQLFLVFICIGEGSNLLGRLIAIYLSSGCGSLFQQIEGAIMTAGIMLCAGWLIWDNIKERK